MNSFGKEKNKFIKVSPVLFLVCALFSFEVVAQIGGAFDFGWAIPNIGAAGPVAYATTVQPDDKIIMVGKTFFSTPNGYDAVIVRLNSNGSRDLSFGTNGVSYVHHLIGNEGFQAVALQPDGKIVAVGHYQTGSSQFMIVRFNPNGKLDSTFDADGIATTNMLAGSFDEAVSVAIQPDGKIVVLGNSMLNNNQDFALARYNSDGSLDASFSDDGKVVLNISNSTEYRSDDVAHSVALQLDGKIVVVGNGNSAINQIVFRLNPNGTFDISFDHDGIVFGPAGMDAVAVAIQWDGKIVGAGNTSNPFDFIVTRYNSDGTLDVSFDGDGIATTNISPTPSVDYARSMALQSDGKIIVGGYTVDTNANFATVRYNFDGSLDTSWGNGGKVTTTYDSFGRAQLYSVASAANGKVVTSGKIYDLFGVLRYQSSAIVATAKISGRVVNSKGQAVSKARVVLTNMQTGTTKITLTNPSGYYNFPDLPTMANYHVSVSSKRHQFYQNTRSLQLFMDVLGLHFAGI